MPKPQNVEPSTWRLQLLHLSQQKQLNIVSVISSKDRNMILVVTDQKTGAEGVLKIGQVLSSVMDEVRQLKVIKHPNIVSFRDSFILGKETICLHIEKVPGESLIEIVMREGKLTEAESQIVFRQIAQALLYLHRNRITHRDVKPDNIIWDRQTKVAKLIDFEFAGESCRWRSYSGGTIEYQPPELLLKTGRSIFDSNIRSSDQAVDVWSFGVSLFVCLTGHYPYHHEQLLSLNRQKERTLSVPPIPDVSASCENLIKSLLTFHFKHRPSIARAIQDPWLSGSCRLKANSEKRKKHSFLKFFCTI